MRIANPHRGDAGVQRTGGVLCRARAATPLEFSPGQWLIISSAVDLTLISLLAVNGILMRSLAIAVVAGLFAAAIIFSFHLDSVKVVLFRRLGIA
jgi:hypothetical protein